MKRLKERKEKNVLFGLFKISKDRGFMIFQKGYIVRRSVSVTRKIMIKCKAGTCPNHRYAEWEAEVG